MRISDWSSDVCSSDLRHPLVVAVLLAWILAVTNEHDPLLHIVVAPADTADLLLAHRAGEREAHDAAHRDEQIAVVVEVVEQAPDLERKSVVAGKRVGGRVDVGGGRLIKKKKRNRDRR